MNPPARQRHIRKRCTAGAGCMRSAGGLSPIVRLPDLVRTLRQNLKILTQGSVHSEVAIFLLVACFTQEALAQPTPPG
jgi:hypothetical protein